MRSCAGVSPTTRGRWFTIFDGKECCNSCAPSEIQRRRALNSDTPSNALRPDASLVRVELVTGLQNQIRAQFSAIGHPVIGDRKYHWAESSERLIARVALHAAHLEFVHPRSGESISIDCELPPDFRHLLQQLSLAARRRR